MPLLLGVVFLIAFGFWEAYGAEYPMLPSRLGKARWNLILTFIITFISGANFFSVLLLWPTQAYNVYGHDPVAVGIRGLPFGFCVMGGACISLYLLSKTGGKIKWILCGASVLMTAGCGAMAAARIDNINAVYGFLVLAGLGVGGIVVPAVSRPLPHRFLHPTRQRRNHRRNTELTLTIHHRASFPPLSAQMILSPPSRP